MRAICVDDEKILMDHTVSMCSELPQIDEVRGFTKPKEALQWLEDNTADLALLDIDMPKINGISIAKKRARLNEKTIFVTNRESLVFQAYNETSSIGFVRKNQTKHI